MMPVRKGWADTGSDDDLRDPWTSSRIGTASPKRFGVTPQYQSEGVVETMVNGRSPSIEPKEQVRRLRSIAAVEKEPARKTATEFFRASRVIAHVSRAPRRWRSKCVIFDQVMNKVHGECLDCLQTDHNRRYWICMKAEHPWVVIGSLRALSVVNDGPATQDGRGQMYA